MRARRKAICPDCGELALLRRGSQPGREGLPQRREAPESRSAGPTSFWPSTLRVFFATVAEIPLAGLTIVSAALGLWLIAVYCRQVGYPVMDLTSMLSFAGLVATFSLLLAASAGALLCAPLLATRFVPEAKLTWRRLLIAQVAPLMTWLALVAVAGALLPDHPITGFWPMMGILVLSSGSVAAILGMGRYRPGANLRSFRDRLPSVFAYFFAGLFALLSLTGALHLIDAFGAQALPPLQKITIWIAAFIFVALLDSLLASAPLSRSMAAAMVVALGICGAAALSSPYLPTRLVTLAGLRADKPVQVFLAQGTCQRILDLARVSTAGADAPPNTSCVPHGTIARLQVDLKLGTRWLVQPLAVAGVALSDDMPRLTVQDAEVELVLAARPSASERPK